MLLPAYLIRSGIDWVRHNQELKDSNPYSRCEESIRTCKKLWEQQIGKSNRHLLEPATITAYWAEFFHAEDPHPDEKEWREGLIKRSGQYDSFGEWQEWFKQSYEKVYKEDNIWMGVLMTAWAHSHQYEVLYSEDSWEFRAAKSYLPTSVMWRLEPHLETVSAVLRELWSEETRAYESIGFTIDEQGIPYLGKVECLGFDTRRYLAVCPPRAEKDQESLEVGEMVADIIAPPGDQWYRQLDSVIFADDYVDITALVNRGKYHFSSHRRLLELSLDNGLDKAIQQASAEGWLVPTLEPAGT